jgi:hypothetical protein
MSDFFYQFIHSEMLKQAIEQFAGFFRLLAGEYFCASGGCA